MKLIPALRRITRAMHVQQTSPASAKALNFGLLVQQNNFKCPGCRSIVYSRKSRFCGVCGQTLPENFLFSDQETARLKNTLQRERSRHREWLAKWDDHGWNMLPIQ